MYEKIGSNIRPLHNLVAGPRGEVLELLPSSGADQPFRASTSGAANGHTEDADEPTWHHNEQSETEAVSEPPSISSRAPRRSPPLSSPPPRGKDERGPSAIERNGQELARARYRKLFSDPGQRRIVRLGDFKAMLTAQLSHPERLRDAHWLPCYLQVYETRAPQTLETLAASELGDPKLVAQFEFLTDTLARRLGVMPFLKPRPHQSPATRHPGHILPYERLFRFQVEYDPTLDDGEAADNKLTVSPGASACRPRAASSPDRGNELKKSIPESMIKPWEFQLTRDEVLYDMNVAKPFAGFLASLALRLKSLIGHRAEMKKWQVLLSGKRADEQLWAIRQPRDTTRSSCCWNGRSSGAVREFSRRAGDEAPARTPAQPEKSVCNFE
jgi:hypothetical protein